MKNILILLFAWLLIYPNILNGQHLKKNGTPDMRYSENKINIRSTSYTVKPVFSHRNRTSTYLPRYSANPRYSFIAERDRTGRIKRNHSATYIFKRETNYPHGRPGYVIDHIIPLKRGGCDCPSNMQWQTRAAAKAKDKIE
jgi:hypothetical protein